MIKRSLLASTLFAATTVNADDFSYNHFSAKYTQSNALIEVGGSEKILSANNYSGSFSYEFRNNLFVRAGLGFGSFDDGFSIQGIDYSTEASATFYGLGLGTYFDLTESIDIYSLAKFEKTSTETEIFATDGVNSATVEGSEDSNAYGVELGLRMQIGTLAGSEFRPVAEYKVSDDVTTKTLGAELLFQVAPQFVVVTGYSFDLDDDIDSLTLGVTKYFYQ